jgi:DNA-binding PadR family transcriptional regulator
MSSIDLILLGLAHDRPVSAYEMQKQVEYRNLGKWVRISTPSIYKRVLALEAQGFLEKRLEREGRMPEKAVYSITPKGLERFTELMREGAAGAVEVLFGFNAVVANLNKLPPGEALGLIDSIRSGIRDSLTFMEGVRPARGHIPLSGRAVLDQQIRVLETLSDWADGFRDEFEWENFPEPEGSP